MTDLWRARAGRTEGEPSPRRAIAIATEIRARIAEGELKEGDRLPPLADLATEFDISRPTLREALRILETEFLLELRTGDRGGAIIRTPTTRVAAQMAGIVLEARRTTLADVYRAIRQVEPEIMELVAGRISARRLDRLRAYGDELAASVEDTERFLVTWRAAEMQAFSAVKNPALTVIAEIFQWVRVGIQPAITIGATILPGVTSSNRNAQGRFVAFVDAASAGDTARARDVWAECLNANAPFIEDSELGRRLMVDLIG
jgi:DNA-binding FadR family transcriptional regulator